MAALTANIRGTIKDATGALRTSTVINFVPISAPLTSGGDIVTSPTIQVTTNGSGQFGYSPLFPLVEGY